MSRYVERLLDRLCAMASLATPQPRTQVLHVRAVHPRGLGRRPLVRRP